MEHFLFFHSVGNVIIPTDFHSIIFQRGRSTTNQTKSSRVWSSISSHVPPTCRCNLEFSKPVQRRLYRLFGEIKTDEHYLEIVRNTKCVSSHFYSCPFISSYLPPFDIINVPILYLSSFNPQCLNPHHSLSI